MSTSSVSNSSTSQRTAPPPAAPISNKISRALAIKSVPDRALVLCGDFNMRLTLHDSHSFERVHVSTESVRCTTATHERVHVVATWQPRTHTLIASTAC